jgi:hypothetical protein
MTGWQEPMVPVASTAHQNSQPQRFPSFFGLGIIAHSLKYKVYLGYTTKVTQPHACTRVASGATTLRVVIVKPRTTSFRY